MNVRRILAAILFGAFVFAAPTLAQDMAGDATVQVMQSEEYGAYLTDAEGRTLYAFVDPAQLAPDPEPVTEGVREAAVSCTGDCLGAWPAFTAEGEVQAGEGANADLLYTATFDDRSHVTYNGYPLFTFANDAEAGQINGQAIEGFGGTWYIVAPDGSLIGADGAGGMGAGGSGDY